MGKCEHTSVQWSEWHDGAWELRGRLSGPPLEPHARFFKGKLVCDCGAWLSLGPSNDEPAEVQVEIRAAELAGDPEKILGCSEVVDAYNCEQCGVDDYEAGTDPASRAQWAGYLARAIATHMDPLTLDEVKSALAVGAEERKAAERYRRAR